MKRTASTSLADQVLDLAAGCFDASTLNALAGLRLSPKLAARVDSLADKANEAELTLREREEYQATFRLRNCFRSSIFARAGNCVFRFLLNSA